MTPTALSQVGEQLIRVVTMLMFATLTAPRGLEYAAAGATFGAAPGALAGLLVMLFFYWRHRVRLSRDAAAAAPAAVVPAPVIIRRLLLLSLPIPTSSIMLPVVANLDLFIFITVAANSNTIVTAAAIVVGIAVYGLAMLSVGGIRATDIKMVPMAGEFLLKILVVFRRSSTTARADGKTMLSITKCKRFFFWTR